jgi:hypothetical protein
VKRFVAILMAGAAIGMTAPATASAHYDLDCGTARAQANHPNANCGKWSPNRAVLWFPWHSCQEVVTLNHYGPWGIFHQFEIQHCGSWSH